MTLYSFFPARSTGSIISAMLLLFAGCARSPQQNGAEQFADDAIEIVATTSIVADLVATIGGEHTRVTGLMGPGVDPHLYKASEGDVLRMAQADVIFYNGIHLEGKMTDVFEQMARRGIPTFPIAGNAVPDSLLIPSDYFAGSFDPHVWFDVLLWKRCAEYVRDVLIELLPQHRDVFVERAKEYSAELEALDLQIKEQIARIPPPQRVLITSHDAFGYFGRAYGFEVRALQGLSTVAEAGTADVQKLAEFVATRKIPAIFVESSVSPRGIEAVKAAVESRNFTVSIGGYLYSDALGDPDSDAATYIGTVRHNIDTIVDALSPSSDDSISE